MFSLEEAGAWEGKTGHSAPWRAQERPAAEEARTHRLYSDQCSCHHVCVNAPDPAAAGIAGWGLDVTQPCWVSGNGMLRGSQSQDKPVERGVNL